MSPYLVLLILDFFSCLTSYATPWARFKCYPTTSQLVNQAICVLLFANWILKSCFNKIIIIIIITIIILLLFGPSGTILLAQYSMVWDWLVSRARPMLFYWLKLL